MMTQYQLKSITQKYYGFQKIRDKGLGRLQAVQVNHGVHDAGLGKRFIDKLVRVICWYRCYINANGINRKLLICLGWSIG